MPGRVVLVVVSPRLPPGQLSWPAWEALRSGPVLTVDGDGPQLPYLRDAGIDVSVGATADQLHARAAAGETVVLLTTGDADAELVSGLGRRLVVDGLGLEQVRGSYDPPGARLLDVVAVMDRLRSPGGCPWDAKQTHESLKPYLLEEAYEAYAALEDGDLADLREELGDVLLQVAFHARLAQEAAEPWSIDDVAAGLVDKLVRRHPHVFAGGSADDLEGTWDALKAAEKGRTSVTEGVPLGQPALSLAHKLQKRAARLGAPVPAYDGVGGELWSLVARCREEGRDPEVELRAVARAFRDSLAAVESAVRSEGREPADLTTAEWEQRWS
ncbi:MAG: MazG family protein [Frankiales bacterium]|nr:MAG: MazG family protein [Frankiales bacterium]